jgi:hypothetical protein
MPESIESVVANGQYWASGWMGWYNIIRAWSPGSLKEEQHEAKMD